MSFRLVTEFSPKIKLHGSGRGVDQIALADFNGDGKIDVAASAIYWNDFGRTASPLMIYSGDGNGGFKESTSSMISGSSLVNYVPRMSVADFNKDGKPDIFCVDTGFDDAPYTGGQNSIFLSTPNGLVKSVLTLQPNQFNHGASVGDVNNDGNLDVVVNALMNSGDSLLLGSASGTFTNGSNLLPTMEMTNPWSGNGTVKQTHTMSALIDINNDKALDLILGNWESPQSPKNAAIYLGSSSGFSSSPPISIKNTPVAGEIVLDIKPIDLNGDNLPDLVMSVSSGAKDSYYQKAYIRLLTNAGNGQFVDETQQRLPQSTTPDGKMSWYKTVNVVDLNHDGFGDLLADNAGYEGTGKVYMNDGTGKFSLLTQVLPDQRIAAGDVDSDGMMDIVASPTFVSSSVQNYQVLRNEMENKHVYKANFGGESLLGSKQNDTFISSSSADKFTGNGGVDTVRYSGKSTDFKIDATKGTVTDSTGVADVVSQISRFDFDDKTLAFDVNGNAGQGYRIYQAAFDRKPDVGGLSFWVQMLDSGKALEFVASQFIASAEFAQKFGQNSSTATFVNKLYQNVLHRDADTGGMNYWQKLIDTGSISRAQALVGFSESNENLVALVGQISSGIELV